MVRLILKNTGFVGCFGISNKNRICPYEYNTNSNTSTLLMVLGREVGNNIMVSKMFCWAEILKETLQYYRILQYNDMKNMYFSK